MHKYYKKCFFFLLIKVEKSTQLFINHMIPFSASGTLGSASRVRGPFLESPGNFLGSEQHFKIKLYRMMV